MYFQNTDMYKKTAAFCGRLLTHDSLAIHIKRSSVLLLRIQIRRPRILDLTIRQFSWLGSTLLSLPGFPVVFKNSSPFTVTVSFRILTGFSFAHPTGRNLIAITFVHIRFYLVTYSFTTKSQNCQDCCRTNYGASPASVSYFQHTPFNIHAHYAWFYMIYVFYLWYSDFLQHKSCPFPPSLWQQKRAAHIIYWSTPAPGIWLHRYRWRMHGKGNVSHRCSLR